MSGNICIIPARGGSKRIPKKNIKDFLAKPIIAYSIEMALETGLFEEVMVSTDDLEIAEIAKSYGAKVPFMRSKETSDDYSTTMAVIKEVIGEYKKNGKVFDSVCCLYATAVLAEITDILGGYKLLTDHDIVMPIAQFTVPPFRSLKLNEYGLVSYIYPEYKNTRSQDLKPWFYDAGQWYWYKNDFILNETEIYTCKAINIANEKVQDIDNLVDWKLAELKYELFHT